MLEMLSIEHQLVIYREIKARSKEFEQMDKLDKWERFRKEAVNQKSERGSHRIKTNGQVKAYIFQRNLMQRKAESVLVENSLHSNILIQNVKEVDQ